MAKLVDAHDSGSCGKPWGFDSPYRHYINKELKMLKIFSPKVPQSKIAVFTEIASPYKEELLQAKGVMANYLRDKKCKVTIKNDPLSEGDCLEVSAINYSRTSISRISVLKEGEIPFLRKIYRAIEIVTKDVGE